MTKEPNPKSAFDERGFEKRLRALKETQESIQSLSSWCLNNKIHHKKIIAVWMTVFKKVKSDQRLALFYLANDVIQYSKRKNTVSDFLPAWAPVIKKVTPMIKDERVCTKIQRIFRIWEERGVYEISYVDDLNKILDITMRGSTYENSKIVLDFQPDVLIGKIRDVKNLEEKTDRCLREDNDAPMNMAEVEELRSELKDRTQGGDTVSQIENRVTSIEGYLDSLKTEIEARLDLIDILEQSQIFYEAQKGEAKVVLTAYRNFGNRVRSLRSKLEQMLPLLPLESPVPSPDINAPSPSPDNNDLELPDFEEDNIEITVPQPTMMSVLSSFQDTIDASEGGSLESRLTSILSKQKGDALEAATIPLPVPSPTTESSQTQNIEVIPPQGGFSLSEFLRKISGTEGELQQAVLSPQDLPNDPSSAPPLPPDNHHLLPTTSLILPPPPPPPLQTTDKEDFEWNTKLPPKFPTWSDDERDEDFDTPESPPCFEKIGYTDPVEYDDAPTAFSAEDVDQRTILASPHKGFAGVLSNTSIGDVDHRNLISLVGSPTVTDTDYRVTDTDYRVPADIDYRVKAVNSKGEKPDIVESVDMEMSDEEGEFRAPPLWNSLLKPPPAPPSHSKSSPSQSNTLSYSNPPSPFCNPPSPFCNPPSPFLSKPATSLSNPPAPTSTGLLKPSTPPSNGERSEVKIAFIDFTVDDDDEFPPEDLEPVTTQPPMPDVLSATIKPIPPSMDFSPRQSYRPQFHNPIRDWNSPGDGQWRPRQFRFNRGNHPYNAPYRGRPFRPAYRGRAFNPRFNSN